MTTEAAFVLTLMVLGYAVVSGLVTRWYVAPALIFIVAGVLLGPDGAGVIEIGADTGTFTVVAQLALTVILFNQAAELDLRSILRRGHDSFRLIVIGIPLTIGLGTATALLILPVMPVWEAVCLAAIVAPLEVSLIEALLEDRRIPERVRHALAMESGCYDGFALAALFAALALASDRSAEESWGWFLFRAEVLSLAAGAVVGGVGALLIARSYQRDWIGDTWAQLATLAVALLCFQVGEMFHGSGFVAAFAGGLACAVVAQRTRAEVPTKVSDAAGHLLELLVFAMFGAAAVIVGWRDADWRVVLFAVLAVFAVRMVAVWFALLRTDVPTRSRLFLGWFGPRGIGTLVLGLLVVQEGAIEQVDLITQTVVVAVTLSLVVHSATAPLGIRLVQPDRLAHR
ncbi:cation:proton antiporter domain-containing protein [Mycolicibacterium tokaiense]|jgi:NhaP-type Na+/H+ or K+/H+ antiporter|uniref:Ion antiporter, NhaP n=1 Tax=Mycolicibacterium tokaiense TaxID=39695 RepID=A0A378TIV7_9MYCO|nr:cation:proton antiporter [Mycolicibacterium tokaiense]BBY84742.1 sodium:proton antiporter [Mycolicibacterium tokaiense]STZ60752.1 ion antiporter, NhaP [Mycolicibacterium tokaiense]